jgi:hypothetical protein
MLLPARPLGPGAATAEPLCPPSVCSSCACAAEAADAEAAPKLAPAPLAAGWPASCSRFKYPDLHGCKTAVVKHRCALQQMLWP